MDEIGKRLLLARKDLNWNQLELSARSGVSAPHISAIESGQGKSNPTIKTIELLAKALNVPPAYLAGWSEDSAGEFTPDENTLTYRAASATAKRDIEQLIELFSDLPVNQQALAMEIIEIIKKTHRRAQ